jgi:hypothetical protein
MQSALIRSSQAVEGEPRKVPLGASFQSTSLRWRSSALGTDWRIRSIFLSSMYNIAAREQDLGGDVRLHIVFLASRPWVPRHPSINSPARNFCTQLNVYRKKRRHSIAPTDTPASATKPRPRNISRKKNGPTSPDHWAKLNRV